MSAVTGKDSQDGSKTSPVATIGKALAIARGKGLSIFVGRGLYREHLTVNNSIYGGFDENSWKRDLIKNATVIVPTNNRAYTVLVPKTARVTLDGLVLIGPVWKSLYLNTIVVNGRAVIRDSVILGPARAQNSYTVYIEKGYADVIGNYIEGGNVSDGGCALKYEITAQGGEVTRNTVIATKGKLGCGIRTYLPTRIIGNKVVMSTRAKDLFGVCLSKGRRLSKGIDEGEALIKNNTILVKTGVEKVAAIDIYDATVAIEYNVLLTTSRRAKFPGPVWVNIGRGTKKTVSLRNNILNNKGKGHCMVVNGMSARCFARSPKALNRCKWLHCRSAANNSNENVSLRAGLELAPALLERRIGAVQ